MDSVFFLFDTMKSDLKGLHQADRLGAAARMAGRPDLLRNSEFRQAFNAWHRVSL